MIDKMKKLEIKSELCKLKKDDIESKFEEISTIIKEAEYICKRCARAAKDKKNLCKPTKIE